MTYEQALHHFGGTQEKLATALGITQSTISAWGRQVPDMYQFKIEGLSGGALKADEQLRVVEVA